MDDQSHLDLALVIEDAQADEVVAMRHTLAASLGPLLTGFSGERGK